MDECADKEHVGNMPDNTKADTTGDTSPKPASMADTPIETTSKRKADEPEDDTPLKKQKTLPAKDERVVDLRSSSEATPSAAGRDGKEGEATDKPVEQTAQSQVSAGKPKKVWNSIEELRTEANKQLKEQGEQIKLLKASNEKLRTQVKEMGCDCDGELELAKSERDDLQAQLHEAEVEAKQWQNSKQSWIKQLRAEHTKKRQEEVKAVKKAAKERAEAMWENRQNAWEEKQETYKSDLKAAKDEIKEQKDKLRGMKPGAAKELKEKIGELEQVRGELRSLQITSNNWKKDLDRIREQRNGLAEDNHELGQDNKKWQNVYARQASEIKIMQAEHEQQLHKKDEKWQIQNNLAQEYAASAIAGQRGKTDLNNALDRNIKRADKAVKEKKEAERMLRLAQAQIQILRDELSHRRPSFSSSPDAVDSNHSAGAEMTEYLKSNPGVPLNESANMPSEAEVVPQNIVAQSHAKTKADAVQDDQQVTQVVPSIEADAQPSQLSESLNESTMVHAEAEHTAQDVVAESHAKTNADATEDDQQVTQVVPSIEADAQPSQLSEPPKESTKDHAEAEQVSQDTVAEDRANTGTNAIENDQQMTDIVRSIETDAQFSQLGEPHVSPGDQPSGSRSSSSMHLFVSDSERESSSAPHT